MHQIQYDEKRGLISSISASVFFAMVPLYVQILGSYSGFAMIGQRVLWTSILLSIVLLFMGRLGQMLRPLKQLSALPGLFLGSLLIGLQWGLFVWAPMNGQTLDLSLGYFLAPISLVFVGRVILKERLYPLQWLAVMLASIGVTYALYNNGGFSIVALLVALGYPLYFLLRRYQPLPAVSAFLIENILLLPLGIWACIYFSDGRLPFSYPPETLLAFSGLAILGSCGMLSLLVASRKLPISLFGLLGYLEPVLIFLVGVLFLQERVPGSEQITYILIISALVLLAVDKMYRYIRS